MSTPLPLASEPRTAHGRGASRAARKAGLVPAVVYGGHSEPLHITVSAKELIRQLQSPAFYTHVYELTLEGQPVRVLPKAVQLDPVTDNPIHIDYLRVERDTTVVVDVPVQFINEAASPGLKRGGVLNIVRHTLELRCPADAIPEHVTIDLTDTDVGLSIHINDVTLPKGAQATIDRNFTIATIAAPSALRSEEGAEGAAEAASS